ncbi:MAG: nitroreductase family protein, partial [Promethearchaeota archaeon]
MKIMGIDDEKCIKCLECVKECPSNLYIKPPTKVGEKRKVIFEDSYNRCNSCGHCVAVCPTAAIIFKNADPPLEFDEAEDPSKIINYTDLIKLLRSRRSIRRFKDKPVPKEEIEAILEAMRYAPSASNMQSWEYIILTNKSSIKKLRNAVISMMRTLKKLLKFAKLLKPFIPKDLKEKAFDPGTKISLDNFFESIKRGEDPVFYKAPVVIITYAPKYADMEKNDAGIAFTYGMLAAQSRGLGTCWIGFAQET